MKRYKVLVLLFSISVVSCQEEIEHNVGENGNAIPIQMSFYAGIENPKDSISTRTVLGGVSSDSYRGVLWNYQDEVYVTNGLQSSKFINTSQGTSEVALLEGELAEGTNYFAAYPYKMVTSSSTSGFTINLPSEQTYCEDGIESETFPMVAQCNDGVFNFKNLCGIFVLQLIGDKAISSITFSGKDASGNAIPVAGYGSVSLDYLLSPSLSMENSSVTSVALKSTEGVCLNTSLPTTFHIVLPVGTYNTFKLVIKATDGTIMTVESEKSLEIKRSNRTTAVPLTYSGIIHYQDLNESGETANCYIVSETGKYKFNALVKGNSLESVGTVESAEVLWESFGTDVAPSKGDLVRNVNYKDGYIEFDTPDVYKEGNAVIAAKDASGIILWSWHIWLTDQPEEQVYYNNAGTMMDRNLGATCATPGDVGALGLLYQWGRKDPFLGSSSISRSVEAKSTGSWPSAVASSSSKGTIEYATKNPMTFITSNASNYDWYYTGDDSTDNTRWKSSKTIYDPCPVGWRIPDGGDNGVWSKALGSSAHFVFKEGANEGRNFSGKFGSDQTIWYPDSGYRYYVSGALINVGYGGSYWSATPNGKAAYGLGLSNDGLVTPASNPSRAGGLAVRCLREGSSSETPSDPVTPTYEDLSVSGTANSYIVNEAGDYKFMIVKGNSSESVGSVSSVEVLWESFGTSETPSVGSLVRNVSYKDGYIQFSTPDTFREGNAVIAAKNSSGTILWSWHIWLTDQPKEQVYYNNAGTMMDRNLGATSATPGDATSLGLLYQWGRKDPFLSFSDISSTSIASSTYEWPLEKELATSIEYTINNPTTFIIGRYGNSFDWLYIPNWSQGTPPDATRWQSSKTIYDPCPSGWRVPDGGWDGIWYKAMSTSTYTYDSSHIGVNFSKIFGNDEVIWYPASGYYFGGGSFSKENRGSTFYWSVTPLSGERIYDLYISSEKVNPSSNDSRTQGLYVRCMKINN